MSSHFPESRYEPPKSKFFFDRRRKTDWITRSIQIIGIAGWILAAGTLLFIDRAKPGTDDFFTTLFHGSVSYSWDEQLLRYSFFIFVGIFVLCLLGMIFNMLRHRRKSDKYNKSIIILGLMSFAGIIYFFLAFSSIFR